LDAGDGATLGEMELARCKGREEKGGCHGLGGQTRGWRFREAGVGGGRRTYSSACGDVKDLAKGKVGGCWSGWC
jgi:hypothetical protein